MKEVTGNLQVKNGKYYVLVNLYDRSGKRSIKWVALGLDARATRRLPRLVWRRCWRSTTAVRGSC